MSPAYFLFLIQIDDKFSKPFNYHLIFYDVTLQINIFGWCGLLLVFILVLTLLLKFILIRQYTKSSTDQVLAPEKNYFKESNLEEKNGNIISFLLGNILPAVFIIESNLLLSICIFVILQVIIFILIVKSTDIFPNINLIILGIDLCKTQNNKYVFTFKSKKYNDFKVYMIGNPYKTKIHITMYEK